MKEEIGIEVRRERAAKGAATRRARKEAVEERSRADKNDLIAALELCRRIRDDETAAVADRLKATELLMRIKSECE